MKNNKVKSIVLFALAASVSIIIGIAVSRIQPTTTMPLSATELENFFGNASCTWPCWQGITPGVTASSEALQKLQRSPLVVFSSIQQFPVVFSVQTDGSKLERGGANWHWKISGNRPVFGGDIEWQNGIVFETALTASSVIQLEEIINKFGPPEKVDVDNCSEVVEAPPKWCTVLFYARNGFEIHLNQDSPANGGDVQITSSSLIDFVVLFKPSSIEEWRSSLGLDPTLLNLRDWKGYGNLIDLYYQIGE